MDEKTVHIPGISCDHCVMNIRRELSELDGIESVAADATTRQVTVRWQAPATWQSIAAMLDEIGYPPAA